MTWAEWILVAVMWFGAVIVIADRLDDITIELRLLRAEKRRRTDNASHK